MCDTGRKPNVSTVLIQGVGFHGSRSTQPTAHSVCLLPFSSSRIHGIPINRDLVGAVSNCADSVRFSPTPTGWRKCLFIFEFTIYEGVLWQASISDRHTKLLETTTAS